MRIAFVWTGLTSYMADAWRRLAAEPDVALKVWVDASGAVAKAVDFKAAEVMRGIDCEILQETSRTRVDRALGDIVAWQGDVLFAVGWHSALVRAAVTDARLRRVPKVCCFDMPWRWQLRCLVAPLVLGRFLRQYGAAFVPGVVCARYAKWLGFKSIHTGLFAIDTEKFRTDAPTAAGRYFLYLGRNSPEKRVDDIRAAHRLYRAKGGRLDLKLFGKGLDGGFVRPQDVPALMHGAAAFVLASAFDPWPLVLLEAMSAGCPVIASDRCTNRPELGRNWRVYPMGNVAALAQAMADCEVGGREARAIRDNVELARQYDSVEWVRRVKAIVKEMTI